MDYGHKESDKMLKDLEKRLQEEYAQTERELAEKIAQYFKAYERKNTVKLMQLKAGQITPKEYFRWKQGQLLIGQRWQEMQTTIATDLHNVNKIAGAMISNHAKDVYALNHNYGTYEVEKGSMVDTSYTLYNRDAVERLMRDNPDILPPPGKRVSQRIAEGKDVLWNKQQVQSVMAQSILQGESIPKIAKRLEGAVGKSYTEDIIKNADKKTAKQIAKELARKNKVAAIRNARTMTTGAENAGRVDAYKRGQEMGVKSQQMWVATLDNRTRHEHRLLDGQKVEVGKPFKVDGEEIRFPGDPTAPPYLVYNCRCGVVAVVKGSKLDKEGIEGLARRDEKLGDMTYDEWKNAKAKPSKPQDAAKPDKGTNTQPEVKKPENEPLSKPEREAKPPRTIEIPQDVREKIDAFENKYQDAKTEHFLSINKDGEVIYESGSGGKRNVSVPKHIDEQMEDGWGIHNHPAKAVFSPEDVRNYEKYGEHGLVIDNDGNEYILFNHNPVAKYKELESATHEQFVELMPFSTEYNKAFNQIDDDISARRREYFTKLKETEPDLSIRSQKAQEWMRENDSEKLKIKWLEENAEDYGFTFQMTKKGGATIAPTVPEMPKKAVAATGPSKTETVVSADIKPTIAFTPAKTIEEAEEYARQNFVVKKTWSGNGNVSYHGMSIGNANSINEEFTRLFAETNMPKLNNIGMMNFREKIWKDGKDAPMAHRAMQNGEIYFNPKILKDEKTLAAYLKKGEESFEFCKNNMDKFSGKTLEMVKQYMQAGRQTVAEAAENQLHAMLDHEFGHHVDHSVFVFNKEYNQIARDGINKYGLNLSGYAVQTKGEYLAESFCAYMNGIDGVDPSLIKIFEEAVMKK